MFKLVNIIFFIALFVSAASLSSAEVYKWINDDGSLGFTNDLTRVPDKYKDKAEKINFQSDAIDKERVYEEMIIPDNSLSEELKRKKVPRMRDKHDRYKGRYSRMERKYENDDNDTEKKFIKED